MTMFLIALATLVAANLILAAFLYFRPSLGATTRSKLSNWVLQAPSENEARNRLLAALRD